MSDRDRLSEHSDKFLQISLLAQIGDFPLNIDAIALTPDGSSLAVAAAGAGIALWGMNSYTQEAQLEMPTEAFRPLAPSPLFEYGSDYPVMVRDLAFSHDGAFVATAFTNQQVSICIREGTLLETLERAVVSLAFVSSSDLLLLCLENGDIELWEVVPARLIAALTGQANTIDPSFTLQMLSKRECTSSSDGTQLAVFSTFLESKRLKTAAYVHIWDLLWQDGQVIPSLQRAVKAPTSLATLTRGSYLRDHHRLCCYDPFGPFWELDTDTGETLALLEGNPHQLFRIYASSPDGTWVAIATREGEVAIWHKQEQRMIKTLQAHDLVKEDIDAISAMTWLPDGKRLVTVGTSRVGNEKGLSSAHKQTIVKIWQIT